MFWMPGIARASLPIRAMASNVLRPIRNVSNCASIPAKSISGSIVIQSYSPLGPAMYPSRLMAPPNRTSRIVPPETRHLSVGEQAFDVGGKIDVHDVIDRG